MSSKQRNKEINAKCTGSMPDYLNRDIGLFNVFSIDPYEVEKLGPMPYRRRDFYKIMLVIGESEVHFADKAIRVQKHALTFSNPLIPYQWVERDQIKRVIYCVFNDDFFKKFGDLNQYSVFQPNGNHVLELDEEQVTEVDALFKKMQNEIDSDYVHKYDLLKNLVYEMIHYAMKMQPSSHVVNQEINASQRIAMLFLELLERQFPIEENYPTIKLKTPSDFARQLNVHVNHLNRVVREVTGKTTTQHVQDRIFQEAKILLKHSQCNISEIGYSLGFNEATHFSNFFRKHQNESPSAFRNV